jgi:hypothetical protein
MQGIKSLKKRKKRIAFNGKIKAMRHLQIGDGQR